MAKIRNVLLLYTDPYYLVEQVYPYGLDLLAARLRADGLAVRIEYAFLPDADPAANLAAAVADFPPDLVGLGIRNIDTCMACEIHGDVCGEGYRSFFFLPRIRTVVDAVRSVLPGIPMICGGGGFTVAPRQVLDFLGLDFGIAGEGEAALSAFVQRWPDRDRIERIPGLFMRREQGFVENPRTGFQFPRHHRPDRDSGFRHAWAAAGLPVRVKRGCNQACSFCVEPIIEGRHFLYRDIEDVVQELHAAAEMDPVTRIFFVDTEFNLPDAEYATALVQRILSEGLQRRFRFASQFLPRPLSDDFARLLAAAGFSVILTCTSFADAVLEAAGVCYREADIREALQRCAAHGIDTTVDLIFGLPAETWDTVSHTIRCMNELPPTALRRFEYTVGARIYPGTALAAMAETDANRNVYGDLSPQRLQPCFYCTPAAPLDLKRHVDARVASPVLLDNALCESARSRLAVGYLADRGRFEEAIDGYRRLDLPGKSIAFDYFFRLLADAGRIDAALSVAEDLRRTIGAAGDPAYRGQAGVLDHYLAVLRGMTG